VCSSKHASHFEHKIDNACKWQDRLQQGIIGQQIENVMALAKQTEEDFQVAFKESKFPSLSGIISGGKWKFPPTNNFTRIIISREKKLFRKNETSEK